MMLPALEVLKKPYQSSLVLKQTVDDVNCIHLIAWKRTSTYVMN